jgi:hypothetical protein
MLTKRQIEIGIESAQIEIGQAPYDTMNRLRYAFPELEDETLLSMALRHPDVARVVRTYGRRLRQYENELAAWHNVRRKKTNKPDNSGGRIR